jgi:hypothetical protein
MTKNASGRRPLDAKEQEQIEAAIAAGKVTRVTRPTSLEPVLPSTSWLRRAGPQRRRQGAAETLEA